MLTQITSLLGLTPTPQNSDSPDAATNPEDFSEVFSLSGKQPDLESQSEQQTDIELVIETSDETLEDIESGQVLDVESEARVQEDLPEEEAVFSQQPPSNALSRESLPAPLTEEVSTGVIAATLPDKLPNDTSTYMQVRPDPINARVKGGDVPIFQTLGQEAAAPVSKESSVTTTEAPKVSGPQTEILKQPESSIQSPQPTQNPNIGKPDVVAAALRSPIFNQNELRPWRANTPTSKIDSDGMAAKILPEESAVQSPLKATPTSTTDKPVSGVGVSNFQASAPTPSPSETATSNDLVTREKTAPALQSAAASPQNRTELPDLKNLLSAIRDVDEAPEISKVAATEQDAVVDGIESTADEDLGLTVQFTSMRRRKSVEAQVPRQANATATPVPNTGVGVVERFDTAESDPLPSLDEQLRAPTPFERATPNAVSTAASVPPPLNTAQSLMKPSLTQGEFDVSVSEDVDEAEISLASGPSALRSSTVGIAPQTTLSHRADPTLVMRQVADALPKLAEGQVEIRLSPEELGAVRMQLTQGEGGLSIQIFAERPETLDLMRRHIDQLARDLSDAGFEGASFSFENQDGQAEQNQRSMGSGSASQADDPQVHSPSNILSDGLDIRV